MSKIFTLIGAESTGKSTLTRQLAAYFGACRIDEFARSYVENLRRRYTYEDVVLIAQRQVWLWERRRKECDVIFQDTDLVITKYWFLEVFGKMPTWLDEQIKRMLPDLYLFCDTDLPWEYDSVREASDEKYRNYLSQLYLGEIKILGAGYKIIRGRGEERFKTAMDAVKLYL